MAKIQAFKQISSHTFRRGFLGLSHTCCKHSSYSEHALPWDGMIWPWLTIDLCSLNPSGIARDLYSHDSAAVAKEPCSNVGIVQCCINLLRLLSGLFSMLMRSTNSEIYYLVQDGEAKSQLRWRRNNAQTLRSNWKADCSNKLKNAAWDTRFTDQSW